MDSQLLQNKEIIKQTDILLWKICRKYRSVSYLHGCLQKWNLEPKKVQALCNPESKRSTPFWFVFFGHLCKKLENIYLSLLFYFKTIIWITFIFFKFRMLCCICIPCYDNSTEDTEHRCPNCDHLIGKFCSDDIVAP